MSTLGSIIFTDSDIEDIPKQRMKRCVAHINAIPALFRLTKRLPWLKQEIANMKTLEIANTILF